MSGTDLESTALQSEIGPLLDRFREAVDSPRNRERLALWAEPSFRLKTVKFRGQPRPLAETGGRVPVQADIYAIGFWGRVFGFNLRRFYTDPAYYLHYYLKGRLRNFEEIQDDSPLVPAIPIFLGLGFEAGLFGVKQVYDDVAEPWVNRDPRVRTEADLDTLGLPDFKTDGLMPLAHRFYAEISEMVRGHGLAVQFPDWGLGVMADMISLRGFDDLVVDMIEEPDFVHRMARRVVDARKQWERDRSAFLGKPIPRLLLYDDDVNIPQISPALYRDMLLPYEKELHDFQGGIAYWHSCGNITPFLPAIREMPTIGLLNVSAWTDVRRAHELFPDTPLEICVHAVDDVLQASPQRMEERLRGLLDTCREMGVSSFTLRAEGITGLEEPEQDLEQVRRWVEVAKRVVEA